MGNIGFKPRTAASVQSNNKGKKKKPRDQLSTPDDNEDTPLDDQPNHKLLYFETHAKYVTWFQSLSNYEIHPKVTSSITTRTQKFADPPNLTTFPYYRIFYTCCKNNSCRLVLNYKFKPVRTLELKGKIIVEFDPGLHQMLTPTVDVDTTTVVTLQNQMTTEEKNYMKILSTLHPSRAALQYAMRQLSGRSFDAELLDRISRKHREERLGDESGSLEKLMEYGKLVENNGGRFTYSHDDLSMRITGVYIQSKLEVELSNEYATRLVFLDGTHNTTRFIMKAIPALSVDCFGYSCPLGLSAVEAESHDMINRVLMNFHLTETMRHDSDLSLSATVVTDRGHAWASPLSQVTSQHFFDTFHFFRDVESHKSAEHERYKKDMRRAIFHIFESEDDLLNHINAIESYATDKGRKLLAYFKLNFRKIALTCTSKSYIGAMNGASSRIEGYMSSLKGKRTIRKLMENFTLTELFQRHDDVTQQYHSKVTKTVNEMLDKHSAITPFAYKAFQASLQNLHEFEIVERSTTACGHTFKVKRTISVEHGAGQEDFILNEELFSSPTFSYEAGVLIPHDILLHPTCTCKKYTSLLLPCGCIAYCFTQLNATAKRAFISENNLHRQYRVEYHPIYQEVLRKKLPPIAGMQYLPPIDKESVQQITSIRYPKNERLRVSLLSGLAQKINDISVTEPLLFKRTVSGFKGLLNFLHTAKNDNEEIKPAAIEATMTDGSNYMDAQLRAPIPKNNRRTGPRTTQKRSNATKTPALVDNQDQSSGSPRSPQRKKPKSNSTEIDAGTAVRRDPPINSNTSSRPPSLPEDVGKEICGPDKKDGTDPNSLNFNKQHSSRDDGEIQDSLNATTDPADRNDETQKTSGNVGGVHNTSKTSAVKDIVGIEEKDEQNFTDQEVEPRYSFRDDGMSNPPTNNNQSQSPSTAVLSNILDLGKKIRVAVREHLMPKSPPRETSTCTKKLKKSVNGTTSDCDEINNSSSPSSSSASLSSNDSLQAIFEQEKLNSALKLRKRLNRPPNYSNMTRLHYRNGKVEQYVYIGDKIGYYAATARFGDEHCYCESQILDIIQSIIDEETLVQMSNLDVVQRPQRITKLGDSHTESLCKEKRLFIGIDDFVVETNYHENEDAKKGTKEIQLSDEPNDTELQEYMEWSFVYSKAYYTNTCPIDTALQMLSYIDSDYELTKTKDFEDIFSSMKEKDYDLARGKYLSLVAPTKVSVVPKETVNLWGKCSDYILDSPFVKWELAVNVDTQQCTCLSFNSKRTQCSEVYFKGEFDEPRFNQRLIEQFYETIYPSTCDKCKSAFTKKKVPQTSPEVLFVNVSTWRFSDTSRQIVFNDTTYDWVGVIYCYQGGQHFLCQYVRDETVYTYDGMKGIDVNLVDPSPNFSFWFPHLKLEALFFVQQSLRK